MVVPVGYEFTREAPRLGIAGDRFAAGLSPQPFVKPAEVIALLALVSELQSKVNELEGERRHLSSSLSHLNEQVRSAAVVQRAMLPAPVNMPGVSLRTLYRPIEALGGDLYDFAPLGESQLGLCLADVCGHGLPAALIGAFLKHAFHGGAGAADAPLEPAEVLNRVNRDLLASRFEDGQFATGLNAVYDAKSRVLRFARAGMPYPILLRQGERPRQLVTAGPLMGAVDTARFATMAIELQPGDCVLFHTDGLDALLCDHGRRGAYTSISDTPWFADIAGQSCDAILNDIHDRLDAARAADWPADDVTIIVLQVE